MSETALSRPGAGIAWMVVTGLLFVMVTGLVKYLGPIMPMSQAAFLRGHFGALYPDVGVQGRLDLNHTAGHIFAIGLGGFAGGGCV